MARANKAHSDSDAISLDAEEVAFHASELTREDAGAEAAWGK